MIVEYLVWFTGLPAELAASLVLMAVLAVMAGISVIIAERFVGTQRKRAARLQAILDSRPAINAGLPESYIKWSQSVYMEEIPR